MYHVSLLDVFGNDPAISSGVIADFVFFVLAPWNQTGQKFGM
jgi:hypothetical protein